jgi:hypothetical protein
MGDGMTADFPSGRKALPGGMIGGGPTIVPEGMPEDVGGIRAFEIGGVVGEAVPPSTSPGGLVL